MMGAFIDLTGKIFGMLTVISVDTARSGVNKSIKWHCLCSCGVSKSITGIVLREGKAKSCGCMQYSGATTHGKTGTLTHSRWLGMWGRVQTVEAYKSRTPPDRWKDYRLFLEDMGECPENFSLERIDNNRPYGPNNCVWIPKAHQAKNTSRTVSVKLLDGRVVCLADAARVAGVKYATVKSRIFSGWSVEKAINNVGRPIET